MRFGRRVIVASNGSEVAVTARTKAVKRSLAVCQWGRRDESRSSWVIPPASGFCLHPLSDLHVCTRVCVFFFFYSAPARLSPRSRPFSDICVTPFSRRRPLLVSPGFKNAWCHFPAFQAQTEESLSCRCTRANTHTHTHTHWLNLPLKLSDSSPALSHLCESVCICACECVLYMHKHVFVVLDFLTTHDPWVSPVCC